MVEVSFFKSSQTTTMRHDFQAMVTASVPILYAANHWGQHIS